jgi:hypothetical protein
MYMAWLGTDGAARVVSTGGRDTAADASGLLECKCEFFINSRSICFLLQVWGPSDMSRGVGSHVDG